MTVPIQFTRNGRRLANDADDNWISYHPEKRDLFLDELQKVLGLLAEYPEVGTPYIYGGSKNVRRLLLSQSQHFLYYRYIKSRPVVSVLAVFPIRLGKNPSF
jgi:plasmid stabilization system protein ParE